MISNEEIKIKLDGYPPELLDNYAALSENCTPEDLNAFVVGMIQFLQGSNETKPASGLSDSTDLRGDLGVDSITIAEVVFLLEDIFEIEIENSDLAKISTLGELKNYIHRKIA
jgi:acyl carrier protein